jgi:hypothetical protein
MLPIRGWKLGGERLQSCYLSIKTALLGKVAKRFETGGRITNRGQA